MQNIKNTRNEGFFTHSGNLILWIPHQAPKRKNTQPSELKPIADGQRQANHIKSNMLGIIALPYLRSG